MANTQPHSRQDSAVGSESSAWSIDDWRLGDSPAPLLSLPQRDDATTELRGFVCSIAATVEAALRTCAVLRRWSGQPSLILCTQRNSEGETIGIIRGGMVNSPDVSPLAAAFEVIRSAAFARLLGACHPDLAKELAADSEVLSEAWQILRKDHQSELTRQLQGTVNAPEDLEGPPMQRAQSCAEVFSLVRFSENRSAEVPPWDVLNSLRKTDPLQAARVLYGHNRQSRRLDGVVYRLDRLIFVLWRVRDTIDGIASPQQDVRHSPDYRSLIWHGTPYFFTANQAPVIELLLEAWADGCLDVGDETLLRAVDEHSPPARLATLFRDHPAWGSLIVAGATKGTRRLQGPQYR
jgi:hypothetical protein